VYKKSTLTSLIALGMSLEGNTLKKAAAGGFSLMTMPHHTVSFVQGFFLANNV
jgi:hypothetical protein